MALKKFRFPCAVVVPDPSQDIPEKRDPHTGMVLQAFTIGTRTAPAGELVEVDEAEAKRVYAIAGSWEDFEAGLKIQELRDQQAERAGGKLTVMRSAGVQSI